MSPAVCAVCIPVLSDKEAASTSRAPRKSESLGLRGHRPALGRANAHRLRSFTELHRNTAGTQNLGCCFPGATRDFCSFLTQLGRKLRSSELQANTERAKFHSPENISTARGICEHLEAIPEETTQILALVRKTLKNILSLTHTISHIYYLCLN